MQYAVAYRTFQTESLGFPTRVSLYCNTSARTHPFYGAPTVLVVFADSTVPTHVPDGSLVLGTMLLAASSIGLGSCWINRAKEAFETKEGKALKAAWGIEETYVGIGNCILGYVKGELPAPAPRKADYIVTV